MDSTQILNKIDSIKEAVNSESLSKETVNTLLDDLKIKFEQYKLESIMNEIQLHEHYKIQVSETESLARVELAYIQKSHKIDYSKFAETEVRVKDVFSKLEREYNDEKLFEEIIQKVKNI